MVTHCKGPNERVEAMRLQTHCLCPTAGKAGIQVLQCTSTLKTVPRVPDTGDRGRRWHITSWAESTSLYLEPKETMSDSSADKGRAGTNCRCTANRKWFLPQVWHVPLGSMYRLVWNSRNEKWMDQEGCFSLRLKAQYRPARGFSGLAAHLPEGILYWQHGSRGAHGAGWPSTEDF